MAPAVPSTGDSHCPRAAGHSILDTDTCPWPSWLPGTILDPERCPQPSWPPGHTVALHLPAPHAVVIHPACQDVSVERAQYVTSSSVKYGKTTTFLGFAAMKHIPLMTFLPFPNCAEWQSSQFVGTVAHTSFQRLRPVFRGTFLAGRDTSPLQAEGLTLPSQGWPRELQHK